MAKLTKIHESCDNNLSNAIILPVPARSKKGAKVNHINQVEFMLSRYSVAKQRFKEFSTQSKDFSPGEIYLFRDVNLSSIDIMDTNTPSEEISKYLEKNSKVIVLIPTKTREDKEITEHVIMGGFRALYNLIKSDQEILDQLKTVSIPYFNELDDLLEKITNLYDDVDVELFICLGLV